MTGEVNVYNRNEFKGEKNKTPRNMRKKAVSILRISSTSSRIYEKILSNLQMYEEEEEEFFDDDIDEWTWESYTTTTEEEALKKDLDKILRKSTAEDKPIKKVKKKKKLPAKMLAEMARKAELEAKMAEEEERLQRIEEQRAFLVKEKTEADEQVLRMEQLHISVQIRDQIIEFNQETDKQEKERSEWEQYLKCDGLPDPYVCGEMYTYVDIWENMLEKTNIEETVYRTKEALMLLEEITRFIESPLRAKKEQIDNWKWIRNLLRKQQEKSLDVACYQILRDVTETMNAINVEKADYRRVEQYFTICLWTMVELPQSLPNPRTPPRPRAEVRFSELNIQIVFPFVINCYRLAVRVMYLAYDHLSDLSDNFYCPPVPPEYSIDLYQAVRDEWYSKLIYKYEQYCDIKRAAGEIVIPQEYDRETGVMPEVPYIRMQVLPSTYIISEENLLYKKLRNLLVTSIGDQVVNLRKTIILGGIFYLNLYFQPPQPQRMISMDVNISRLFAPKCLRDVPFCATYKPTLKPSPSVMQTPEEIEEYNKREETNLEKLIFVTVQLPTSVMWFDTPTVCQWIPEKKVWSTSSVYDFRFLEETASVSFRSSKFGCFSFAMNRFSNMPYQSWDIKAEVDGTVTLQLSAAIVTIDLNVKDNVVCIMSVQNCPNNALQDHVGVYYKLNRLKHALVEAGIDVFPFYDAYCYVEGACEKHWPMEKHLYFQLAQASTCYNFTWSRWNMISGRRSIVIQMRDYKPEKIKQANFSLVQITPLNAQIITCPEASSEFTPEVAEGALFYADLFTLIKGISSIATRSKIQNASPLVTATLAELLQSTRMLSFS